MSPRRAPIAMRMPISRVRSVTETSMMFMMPMPPTSSEIAGDAHQQEGQRLLLRLRRRHELVGAADGEVVGATGGDVVPLLKQRGDRRLRARHVVGVVNLHLDLADELRVAESLLRGAEGHVDHVVLVGRADRALRLQDADHLESLAVDQHALADGGRAISEEVLGDGGAEDGDRRIGALVGVGEPGAIREGPTVDDWKLG